MKILIATDMNIEFVCGSTYSLKRIGNLLKKKGYSFTFVCPGRNYTYHKYIYDGFEVWGVGSFPTIIQKGLRFAIPFIINRNLRKILAEYRPDIIHIQSHGPLPATIIKIAAEMNISVVGTNHFVPDNVIRSLRLPKFLALFLTKVEWKHLNKVFRKIDNITVPTITAAKLLKKNEFSKTVRVISNGIDLYKFTKNGSGNYLYNRYHIPPNKPILLFVGRLDPEKNVNVFIRALPIIINKIEIHSVIVGTGNQMARLQKMTTKLGLSKYITFTGFLPDKDLANIYRIASCFVMPGNAELQSIATMEAMASGLPVVAVDAMALPELIHNGENGYLFPDGDSQTLAKKAIAILSDKKLSAQMSQKSLEIIKAHDLIKIMGKYESLYHESVTH